MSTALVPTEIIESKILLIRGQKVMMDYDLAQMYEVTTFYLNRQVWRNIGRFTEYFMIYLTRSELNNLKCHFGMSSWGGKRALPLAFMLNKVLWNDAPCFDRIIKCQNLGLFWMLILDSNIF